MQNESELKLRLDKVRPLMRERNLEALLIYSSPLKAYFVHYVSNYTLVGEGALVALTLDRDPVLWITEEWDLDRAREESWVKEVRSVKNLANAAAAFIGPAVRNVGIVGLEWGNVVTEEEFRRAFANKLVEVTDVLDKAGMTKTPLELENIRQASRMADVGFMRALEVSRAGIREYELAAEMEFAMRQAGAADNFGLLVSGKKCVGLLLPRDKRLEEGDRVLLEISPVSYIRSYSSQLCRTIWLGNPRRSQQTV